jgi:hypothetical protein
MSIIAAGTTTTTALSSTGNTDGTLQFQVNGTTPSVTLNALGAVGVGASPSFGSSGQALLSAGSTAAPAWGNVQAPLASGTNIKTVNSESLLGSGDVVVGFRNIPSAGAAKTGAYTLATTDIGEFVEVGSGGSITIPNAVFAAGDVVSIFNNTSGNVTITCSITTAYKAGTDADQATVTLQTRGVCTVLFISGTVCVISGNLA